MRLALSMLGCLLVTAGLFAQKATLKLEPVERQMPAYIRSASARRIACCSTS